MKTQLSRRHFLRAAGSLIALPALESIGFRTFAAEKTVSRPKRMIFLGMGFGVTQETWFPDPTRVGAGGGAGVKMGHHLVVEKHTPLCNLWLIPTPHRQR